MYWRIYLISKDLRIESFLKCSFDGLLNGAKFIILIHFFCKTEIILRFLADVKDHDGQTEQYLVILVYLDNI